MVFRRKIKNINNKIIGGSKYEFIRSNAGSISRGKS